MLQQWMQEMCSMEKLKKIPTVSMKTDRSVKKEHRRLTVRKELYDAIMKVKKQNNLKSVNQTIELLFKLSQLNQDLEKIFKVPAMDVTDNRAIHLQTPEMKAKSLKARKEALQNYYNRGKK